VYWERILFIATENENENPLVLIVGYEFIRKRFKFSDQAAV
jgi:hypothetical protein